ALGASALTILGAMLIAGATVSDREAASAVGAIRRECDRYNLDMDVTLRTQEGFDEDSVAPRRRSWLDFVILAAAVAVFAWFAVYVRVPRVPMHIPSALVLSVILIAVLAACGWLLWKRTRFA
ncbi:MAG: EamA/RhaT family transporter, partial [Acidobacteriaceae bacterium]